MQAPCRRGGDFSLSEDTQQQIIRETFHLVSKRDENVCNFLEGGLTFPLVPIGWELANGNVELVLRVEAVRGAPWAPCLEAGPTAGCFWVAVRCWKRLIGGSDNKLIYRHYATLYFVFCVDSSESELGILDLIQVFVETLDKCFENVCELDLIFHVDKVHNILAEMVMGGMVLETNMNEIVTQIDAQNKLEKSEVLFFIFGSGNLKKKQSNKKSFPSITIFVIQVLEISKRKGAVEVGLPGSLERLAGGAANQSPSGSQELLLNRAVIDRSQKSKGRAPSEVQELQYMDRAVAVWNQRNKKGALLAAGTQMISSALGCSRLRDLGSNSFFFENAGDNATRFLFTMSPESENRHPHGTFVASIARYLGARYAKHLYASSCFGHHSREHASMMMMHV
ncbi:AP-3 complex subunit sigma-1 [Chelonia mydas]|uniref:AP-3 complex subunit sigma-1 n=1 Tax=Chelonia mydas TaxID=8469 RepID=M7BPR3_CHEMY|nr:AP-3 complex subunit sigma-1 [Chelonia mydas]